MYLSKRGYLGMSPCQKESDLGTWELMCLFAVAQKIIKQLSLGLLRSLGPTIFFAYTSNTFRFPNVSAKGRGFQIRAMSEGPEGWDDLRKVSIWQTTAALQKEMKAKTNKERFRKK